jgi:uncharacterized protein DUF2786
MMDNMNPGTGEATKSLIDKVRKLLAMAEGASNANEADAFSRKAAELIAVHRIDPLRLVEAADDRLTVRSCPIGRGAYVRARLALLQTIAEANSCRLVWQAGPVGTVALVAGFVSDVDTTEMLYTSLHAQASSRMSAERRATGAATQRWRRSFLLGYANQVGKMLQRTHEAAARDALPSSAVLPALRARERRVDEYARTAFGRVVSARPASAATLTGWQAGQTAATRADVGQRRIGALRAIGAGS